MSKNFTKVSGMIVIVICIISLLTACVLDEVSQEVQWLHYPDQIAEGAEFEVQGEYITINSGEEIVEIILHIKEVTTQKSIYNSKIVIPNSSQNFTFSNIMLDEINDTLYFEIQLIISGNLVQKIDTASDPAFVSNWHSHIVTTYFNPETLTGDPASGTWGNDLTKENPYFFALPYRDFYYYVWNRTTGEKELKRQDYYGITDVKNRWIEIYYPATGEYCYAQWEDVGPWNYYDPYYVFSSEDDRPYAEIGIDMGWNAKYGYRETNLAGLDISPQAMKYLNNDVLGKIIVNWRFVSYDQVPDGPWLNKISVTNADPEILNLQTQTLRTLQN